MSRGGARVWGNAHPAAQLTDKRVIRYRNLVRSGKATVGELAAREGCSHGRISMAVRGATWAHLNDIAPPVPGGSRQPAARSAPAAPVRKHAGPARKGAAPPRKATAQAAKRVTTQATVTTKQSVKRAAAKQAPPTRNPTAPARKAAVSARKPAVSAKRTTRATTTRATTARR